MTDSPAPAWRVTFKRRLLTTAAVLALWVVVVEVRLVHLQVFRHKELARKARLQQLEVREVPGKRGEILERNGAPLALNADFQSISAAPSAMEDPVGTAHKLCEVLPGCTKAERDRWIAKFTPDRDFVWVRRNVPADQVTRVTALKLDGVGSTTESGRFYPNKQLAANVVGYVNIDLDGMGGIEGAYNKVIQGEAGKSLIHRDAKNVAFRDRIEKPATVGASLELTLDKHAQYVAERELEMAIRENHAKAGMVVVQDPFTGEVLVAASYPTFNPNTWLESKADARRNRVVQDVVEPGSVMKAVTAAAALEQKVVRPDDMMDVSGGKIRFGSDVISDTHPYGKLTFTEVIVKSSNVGAIQVGLRLGPQRLTEYIERFGFGRKLKTREFPGQSAGIVWDPEKLTDRALARVAMGYHVGVTPLQMASAISSIANGGELVQAQLLKAIIHSNGQRETFPRVVLNRTVTPDTAAQVTAIMEGVVTDGTGTQAQIPGYRVAGKTGTAAKLIDGAYSDTQYNASFVGFVPSRKPAFTIVVVIDSPDHRGKNGYYGGTVAAPVFRRIAAELLRVRGIPPTVNAPPPVLVRRNIESPTRPGRGPVMTPVVHSDVSATAVPDLRGLGVREASNRLTRLGMTLKVHGSGVVVAQRPVAGAPIESGGVGTLWLSRESQPLRSEDPPRQ